MRADSLFYVLIHLPFTPLAHIRSMKPAPKLLLALLVAGLFACNQSKPGATSPTHLLVEYASEPLGIATEKPRFSWRMNDDRKGARQTAWQVQVATTEAALAQGKADVWDSGKKDSDSSHLVPFEGAQLASGKRYFWRVKTWDKDGKEGDWSPATWFETSLLRNEFAATPWVGIDLPMDTLTNRTGDVINAPRSSMVRKEFSLKETPVRARAYVSAAGGYEMRINGEKVGNEWFTPGWTDYHKRIFFQTFDVTSLLKKGENAAAALLGNLWWSSGLGWNSGAIYSKGPLRFAAMLVVEYPDGSTDTLRTGPDWKGAASPILENTLYHGEVYDARKEQPGWDRPGFAAADWKTVSVLEAPSPILSPALAEPIRITGQIEPVTVQETGKDTFIYDLGQNMVGLAQLKVKGAAGTRVQLRFAEVLTGQGRMYVDNLRKAKATDVYIVKGGETETWTPRFTYHGFRYVEITGYPGKPGKDAILGLVMHNDVKQTGDFSSDEDVINKIHHNLLWGLKGNLHSVPTDCPQRDERLGWMGDAQTFAPTASYLAQMAPFFGKYLQDIRDGQDPSGYVYDVHPAIVVDGPAKPGWGDAVAVIPWGMYQFYGDTRILEENYDAVKAWVTYMEKKSKDNRYIWSTPDGKWFGYADWIAPVKTPEQPISVAYYFRSTRLLASMASVLGKTADQRRYDSLATRIALAYQQDYFDAQSFQYQGKTQTANLMPVAFGITPEEFAPAVIRNVAQDVLDRNVHLSTGFLGTGLILPMLSEFGHHELALKLITQTTPPSWGYMTEKGSTTMWELWDSDTTGPAMNSRNHFALGAVGDWMYGYLGGIQPMPDGAGFKHIRIAPRPGGDLKAAKAKVETPYGIVAVQWEFLNKELNIRVKVPANTRATILIPTLGRTRPSLIADDAFVFKDEAVASSVEGLRFLGKDEEVIAFEADAGEYHFKLLGK